MSDSCFSSLKFFKGLAPATYLNASPSAATMDPEQVITIDSPVKPGIILQSVDGVKMTQLMPSTIS
jgi:hypothetical protein